MRKLDFYNLDSESFLSVFVKNVIEWPKQSISQFYLCCFDLTRYCGSKRDLVFLYTHSMLMMLSCLLAL